MRKVIDVDKAEAIMKEVAGRLDWYGVMPWGITIDSDISPSDLEAVGEALVRIANQAVEEIP